MNNAGYDVRKPFLKITWDEYNKVLYKDPEWLAYIISRIPAKRPGQPTALDGIVVFLSAKESGYVTGQILLVDGGISTGATRATPTS